MCPCFGGSSYLCSYGISNLPLSQVFCSCQFYPVVIQLQLISRDVCEIKGLFFFCQSASSIRIIRERTEGGVFRRENG